MAARTASSHWRTRPARFVREVRAMHWIRAQRLAVPLAILVLLAGLGSAAASSPAPVPTVGVAPAAPTAAPSAAAPRFPVSAPIAPISPGTTQPPTSAPATLPAPLVHVVVRGDTMWGIARRYDVRLRTLIDVNPQIETPRLIHPGDRIWIPREAMHVTSVGRPTHGTLVLTESTTLTADHRGNIVIRGDGVTLDCAGHVVRGPGIDGDTYSGGIDIAEVSNVTVKGCIVSGFVRNGLFGGGSNISLEADWFVGNGNHGVHLASVSTGLVTGCTSRLNGTAHPAIGIVVTKSTGVSVSGNVVAGHEWSGIALFDGTSGSTVARNTVTGNYSGITIQGESNDNVVRGNTVSRNSHGIGVLASRRNLVDANTANSNEYIGFSADWGSSSNTFSGNIANLNNDGFNLLGVNGNVVTGNTANRNRHAGFLVWSGSSDNTLSHNTALRNGFYDAWEEGTGSGDVWSENTFRTTFGV
jgi:parallel beta-helix repeat protein